MEVILYQLAIVVTISLAWWRGSTLALWVAIGWSVESLAQLFYPPLILIQLAVVWGTYSMLHSFAAKNRQIEALLKDLAATTRDRILQLDASDLEMVDGPAHARLLEDAVASSRESLCILSGWISHSVIDARMVESLERAIERGVHVYIGYGYKDYRGLFEMRPSTKRALRSLRSLNERSESCCGSLWFAKIGTHEKMLVRDTDFFACGSHNWLSNAWFVNRERSVLVRRREMARAERDRIQKLVSEFARTPENTPLSGNRSPPADAGRR